MSTKRVLDFFKNKVTIRLKNGQQMRGLLTRVDNQANIIVLEDIEDLGNLYQKDQIPLDKKIAQKAFEAENIEEVMLTDQLFVEPKKYQREDFFDSMTEHQEERGNRDRQERGDRRGRGKYSNYRGGQFEGADRNYDKPRKQYHEKNWREGERGRDNRQRGGRRREDDERKYR